MTEHWSVVRLGDVLRHRKEFITIDDFKQYTRCRVQLHAQGIVERDRVTGALIKTKRQQVCRATEFLVAEIDAKVGGFGVVPPELDGAIVSSHYFLFEPNTAKLDSRFLAYYSRSRRFREQVRAQGSTNYAAIRPSHVLDYRIPLPSLSEQAQVVARMDELASKVEEVRSLRARMQNEQHQLLLSAFHRLTAGAPRRRMGDVAPVLRRPVRVREDADYPELGIRSFGKGTFHKPALPGIRVGSKKLFEIRPGDLVLSNVFAWEGAVAVARDGDGGRYGSHRFITCVPHDRVTTSKFLCFNFLTPDGLEQLRKASPGGAGRNRTLGLNALSEIEVPIPAFETQLWFDDLVNRFESLKVVEDDSARGVDALLPSTIEWAFNGRA